MNMFSTFPPTTRRVPFADGLTLRFDERGGGSRPLLVVHGAAGPQSVTGFSEAMAEQARVLTLTHPGFNGEPRPEWFTDVDDLALAYLELLELLELRDVVVVGFSFGGWIASEMAVRDTGRLGALILVDAAGIVVEGQEMSTPTPGGPPPSGNRPQAGFGNQTPGQAAERAANMQTLAVYARDGFFDAKLRRRLARVKLPALVIWGENDPIISPAYGFAYSQALPDTRFVLIPEAGHLPQLDQPERLLNAVQEFTNTLS